MNDYFYKVPIIDSAIPFLTLADSSKQEDWIEKNGFQIMHLNPSFFKISPLFKLIVTKKASPLILKMNPMTWYDWHTDETRQCSINMLISGWDSKCFFGDRKDRDIVNITELKYEPNTYYLLNTQVKHAVLNLSNIRYVLSIGFNNPNTYASILQQLQQYE